MATYDQQGQQVDNQTNIAGNVIGVNVGDVDGGIHDSTIAGRDVHVQNIYQLVEKPSLYVNVPSMPNYFVGRDELMQELVDRLLSGGNPALSAEGLPGVGKTTMAVALAHHPKVLEHFKDGVLWGGLGKQSDVMRVLAIWAAALGKDVSSLSNVRERTQAVKNIISQRHLLLVIDDAWEMDEANLLRCGGPNCCHILTTRDQAIAREFSGTAQVQTVPVLDNEIAYQFLKKLAPETCAADLDSTQKLVKAVGGLPLSLELLGGYLAAPEHSVFPELSVAALANMSVPQQRLQLASQRLGPLSDQKTTLQETITLSVEDLPEAALTAFYALGAFAPKPETFGRRAAEIVTKNNVTTLALLIGRNLMGISQDKQLTFHQTLADVARTKTTPEAIEQHRTYYLDRVNEDREDWERIESIYGQLKWAWEAAPDDHKLIDFQEALDIYQHRRGFWSDLVAWIQRVICLAQSQGWQAIGGRLLDDLGNVYGNQGQWDEAVQMFTESLRIARELGDHSSEGQSLNNLGEVYTKQGQWDEAVQMFNNSLRIKGELGDRYGEGTTLNNLGKVYFNQGQWDEAIQMFNNSLRIKEELGDRYGKAQTLNQLGIVYDRQGRWGEATQMFNNSLHISRDLGDIYGEAKTLNQLGIVYDRQGQWDEAIQMFNDSLHIRRDLGDRAGEGTMLNNLGLVYTNQERWDDAIQIFDDSLRISRDLGDIHGEAKTLNNLGLVYTNQKRWDNAIQILDDSLRIFRDLGDIHGEGITLNSLGEVYEKQGQWDEAIQMYNDSLHIYRDLGDRAGEGYALNCLGNVYNSQNEPAKAEALWLEALKKLYPDSPTYKRLVERLQQRESNS